MGCLARGAPDPPGQRLLGRLYGLLETGIGAEFGLPAGCRGLDRGHGAGDLAKVDWARIPWQGWGAIGYAGLVAIFLCFIIWYESVKEVGSAKTGVYSNLTPILAIFVAGLVLGERLSATQAIGAAVTLAGVYLTRSGYRFFERKGAPAGADGEGRPAA
ncbi:MAG: family transporter [Candidatus Aminicenantes bacterium]|nr:family transporter [Candidatus Aminicenantes bacterium]